MRPNDELARILAGIRRDQEAQAKREEARRQRRGGGTVVARPDQPMHRGRMEWRGVVGIADGRGGARDFDVRVVWGRASRAEEVYVDGRKVNKRHRREWVQRLAAVGITAERVAAASAEGRERVLSASPVEFIEDEEG